jgi:hypothetical protein
MEPPMATVPKHLLMLFLHPISKENLMCNHRLKWDFENSLKDEKQHTYTMRGGHPRESFSKISGIF